MSITSRNPIGQTVITSLMILLKIGVEIAAVSIDGALKLKPGHPGAKKLKDSLK